jgi:hypothetical protein
MRIRAGWRGFTVSRPSGRHVVYPWWVLVPPLFVLGLFTVSLLFFADPLVSNYMRAAYRGRVPKSEALKVLLNANRVSVENLLAGQPAPLESALPTLKLFVPNNTFVNMQRALDQGDWRLDHDPGGTRPYFRSIYIDEDGNEQRSKICLRGTLDWHHHFDKPSLRIKVDKDQIRGGRHYIELTRPEDTLALKNVIPVWIGARHGLISDGSEIVRLFVNQKYFGVYVRTMRCEESMALASNRMPGTFFKGEWREPWSRWTWDRALADLWGPDPHGWTFEGEDAPEDRAFFERFLDVLRPGPNYQSVERLADVLDMDAYARWAAVSVGVGGVHTDAFHNHVYYLCSNQGKLEPLLWDCNALGMEVGPDAPPDTTDNPVLEIALSDPRWVHRRNQILRELLDTDLEPAHMTAEVDAALERMRPDLMADMNLGSARGVNVKPDLVASSVLDIDDERRALLDWVKRRHAYLESFLADARVRVEADPAGGSRVGVAGHAAVLVQHANGARVKADTWPGTPDLLYPGISSVESNYEFKQYMVVSRTPYSEPAPLVYHVDAPPQDLKFVNAITGATVAAESGHFDAAPLLSIHPSQFKLPDTSDVVLGPGDLEIAHDLITAKGQALVIRPGTRLRLAPGVGIYAHGPVYALGLAEQPIEVIPRDDKPWATFGVSGAATAGSRFEHFSALGGSLGTDGYVRFKGMFDVYDCPDVVLRECSFARNFDSDDAVNIGQSKVLIERCHWQDTCADALDFDMSSGEVRDCVFLRAGNDALDLMTCNLTVRGCLMVGSGDKGISIGEATDLRVEGCVMESCSIGAEPKDGSRALFVDTQFLNCGIGLHEYEKKWVYRRGGSAALVDCTIANSVDVDVDLEKRTDALFVRTPFKTVRGEGRLRRADELQAPWIAEWRTLEGLDAQ